MRVVGNSYIPMLGKFYSEERRFPMLRFKYALTTEGSRRCIHDEFYLQKTPRYKGYTEKIFRILYRSRKSLTIREISELTGIQKRSVNGVITFNIMAGYIKKELI